MAAMVPEACRLLLSPEVISGAPISLGLCTDSEEANQAACYLLAPETCQWQRLCASLTHSTKVGTS